MNRIFRYMAAAFAAFALFSCEGTVDPNADGGNSQDGIGDVPEGVLRIFADKSSIKADGNDVVTFTVMFGSQDVSNAKTLQLIRTFQGEEKLMSGGANKYSTVTAGTYTFKAKYYYGGAKYTDNEVVVEATQFYTGEAKDYRRRFLGTLFTSVGCPSCPLAADGLKDLQKANPGVISIAALHLDMDMWPDPMKIPACESFRNALGGFLGLPHFFWSMKAETGTGGDEFFDSFEKEMEETVTYSGVAVNTTLDGTKLDVEVGITSNMPAKFHYQIILVEDDIPAKGDYALQGEDSDYIHYNAVRAVLTDTFGDKINNDLPLTVGVEAKAMKSIRLSPEWKPENMRVIVSALTAEDGENWTVNNVNECKVGESVSYLYN